MTGSARPLIRLLILIIVLPVIAGTRDAAAQWYRVSEESAPNGRVVTFEIEWAAPLRAVLDSAGVSAIAPRHLATIGGGLVEAEYTVGLAATFAPPVSLVDADFETEFVPLAPGATTFAPVVPRMEGVGLFRKRPVGTIVVPVFGYDETTGQVRRYSRVSIRVSGIAAGRMAGQDAQGGINQNPHLLVTRSVLADGQIIRIPITAEGIYRIDRAFLTAAGLAPDTIEPNRLRLFGNGGVPNPALNSAERYADLVENRVLVRGGGDGRFDEGDVLFFYASGPRGWQLDDDEWVHYVHPFSRENAVFLKVDTVPGARLVPEPFPALAGLPVLDRVPGRWFTDFEEQVWSREHGSGHDWVSTTIRSGGSRKIVDNVVPPGFSGGTVNWQSRIAIASNPRATVSFESGGVSLQQRTAPSITINGAEFPTASVTEVAFPQIVVQGGALNLTMRLLQQINEPEAAIDWIRASYDQRLVAAGGLVRFAAPKDATGNMEFLISGFASAPTVWDVTRPHAYRSLGVSAQGGSWRVQVTREAGAPPIELVAFVESAATTVVGEGVTQVTNQNVHGAAGYPDLAIITPAAFRDAADELADMRRAEGLEVVVSEVRTLYNEFSGGIPDARAVRDYLKFLYDRAPDEASLPRWGLLFGDGHYDYRSLANKESSLSNWIFPYETAESFNTDAAFTSDDYFGLLDDSEGVWTYTTFGAVSNERMDIGIGRIPVQTAAEAAMVVDKIRRYEATASRGPWRSLYTFVADDGPTGLAGQQDDADLHLQNVDQVAELIRLALYPQINVRKIYAESFERVFLNGYKIPAAKRAINDALNNGTLMFNYSGHGGPEGLAQEEIFTKADAEILRNRERPSIFVTATCSFGWWDLDDDQSGAEALLLNPNGGAIALLTTVRLVYTSGDTTSLNAGLNRALNIELFAPDPDGGPRRLGDAMLDTKNTRVGLQGNSRKFNLLGDPSMRVGLPVQDVAVDAINDVPLLDGGGQMKALDKVTVTGRVLATDGQTDIGFDGIVDVAVYDATRNVPLVRQLRMPNPWYTIRKDLLWRGEVRAQAGQFGATFVVPKDISYSNRPGRISAYAYSEGGHGLGYAEEFLVGGTSDNPPDDTEGPEIRLFLNDTTFVSGGLTAPDPLLIVQLYDESGMNTVGAGVGHEMLLVLDGDEGRAFDIGSEFRSRSNSYQRGDVNWLLSDLEPGAHTLSVRAWDVLNNSATAELHFLLADDGVLTLRNVYNYPNPMNRETRFVFEHNLPPGTPAQVEIRVYSLSGRPVRTIPPEEALPAGILPAGPVQIPWDGLDDDFDRIATGIYLYRVRVEAENPDGERQSAETIEKLAVIR